MSKLFTHLLAAAAVTALAGTAIALPVVSQPQSNQAAKETNDPAVEAPSVKAPQRATSTVFTPTYAPDVALDFDQFTVINVDGGKTWSVGGDFVRCSFDNGMSKDDWFISPGLNLQAGKSYKFSADVRTKSDWEAFEVKVGKEATVAGMTQMVIDKRAGISHDGQWVNYSNEFTVETDGVYYVGFHACSGVYRWYLDMKNFRVEAPLNLAIPSVATEVSATAAENGDLTATISFTTPTTSKDGNELTELTSAVVTREDGSEVGRIENPAPGTVYSVVDNEAYNGYNMYNVVVNNSEGASDKVSTTVFVGFARPADVTNFKAVETAEGVVTLTWDPVTKDANGKTLPEGSVQYAVYDENDWMPLNSELTESTYSYTAKQSGEQGFMRWRVKAWSEYGNSSEIYSSKIFVGTPLSVPYSESAANGSFSNPFMVVYDDPNNQCNVSACIEGNAGVVAQDGDNGVILLTGWNDGASGSYVSGKIALPADAPQMLTYYLYSLGEDHNDIVMSMVDAGEGPQLLAANECVGNGWMRISADLSAYAGKTITLQLMGMVVNKGKMVVDNIRISPLVRNDLAIVGLTVPQSVDANSDITAAVSVENQGMLDAETFSVELYMNDVLFGTQELSGLGAGAKTSVAFTVPTSPLTPDQNSFYAVVKPAADENADNNVTAAANVDVIKTDLPAPYGVEHSQANGSSDVALTWVACETSAPQPVQVTEDFEDEAFVHATDVNALGWLSFDGDQKNTNCEVSSIATGVKRAFTVVDATQMGRNANYNMAASGNKYIGSIASTDWHDAVNDWVISPELSGLAQTISFKAKAGNSSFPEMVEVWYTNGESTNTGDFVQLETFPTTTVKNNGNKWTLLEANLPEGAKRFALRSVASGGTMLQIDDITYTTLGEGLEVLGYNVYRDGVKVNSELVTTNSYNDLNVPQGLHNYNVTAVYSNGESRPSENYAVTGLENLGVDNAAVEYYNLQGVRVANPTNGVFIKRQGNVTTKVIFNK